MSCCQRLVMGCSCCERTAAAGTCARQQQRRTQHDAGNSSRCHRLDSPPVTYEHRYAPAHTCAAPPSCRRHPSRRCPVANDCARSTLAGSPSTREASTSASVGMNASQACLSALAGSARPLRVLCKPHCCCCCWRARGPARVLLAGEKASSRCAISTCVPGTKRCVMGCWLAQACPRLETGPDASGIIIMLQPRPPLACSRLPYLCILLCWQPAGVHHLQQAEQLPGVQAAAARPRYSCHDVGRSPEVGRRNIVGSRPPLQQAKKEQEQTFERS